MAAAILLETGESAFELMDLGDVMDSAPVPMNRPFPEALAENPPRIEPAETPRPDARPLPAAEKIPLAPLAPQRFGFPPEPATRERPPPLFHDPVPLARGDWRASRTPPPSLPPPEPELLNPPHPADAPSPAAGAASANEAVIDAIANPNFRETPAAPATAAMPPAALAKDAPPAAEPLPAMKAGGDSRARGVRLQAAPHGEFAIRYPERSRRRGESGTALVEAIIGADGRCLEASVARSSGHPALDAAALAAVRGARFSPAREDGAPIIARDRFEIVFELR